jgi:hypothetical protein
MAKSDCTPANCTNDSAEERCSATAPPADRLLVFDEAKGLARKRAVAVRDRDGGIADPNDVWKNLRIKNAQGSKVFSVALAESAKGHKLPSTRHRDRELAELLERGTLSVGGTTACNTDLCDDFPDIPIKSMRQILTNECSISAQRNPQRPLRGALQGKGEAEGSTSRVPPQQPEENHFDD